MDTRKEIKQLIERYLNHEASADEARIIKLWFENDRALGQWHRRQVELESPVVDEATRRRLDAAMERSRRQSGAGRRRRRLVRLAAAAVAALALVGAGALAGRWAAGPAAQPQPFTVSTSTGQRSSVALPDGSTVAVNAMTEMSYCYDSRSGVRSVALAGEAFFDVAPDPAHPFVVSCGEMTVECRGTAFNVKAYADDADVTVALSSGAVSATAGGYTIDMKPDMMVRYDRTNGAMTSQRVVADDYCDWTRGFTRFEGERLGDIARWIARNHRVKINILPPELADERFSGSLASGSLADILDILSIASNLTCQVGNDNTITLLKAPEGSQQGATSRQLTHN